MKPMRVTFAFLLVLAASMAAFGQQHGPETPTPSRPQTSATPPQQQTSRDATREKLRTLLDTEGPKINITFQQSEKQPYNFVGVLKTGLKNADALEVVISVSAQDTIHFRIFPHYKDSYVNVISNGKWKMNLPDHVMFEYQGLFVAGVATALTWVPAPLSRFTGAG